MYKLDPAHFFSAPNLSWDAMLLSIEAKLGLLDGIDKLLFFERTIRGGINGIGEIWHFTANTLLLTSFSFSETTTFDAFLDVISLYAGTMQQMQQRHYNWNTSITLQELLDTPKESSLGNFVEVTFYIPSIYTMQTMAIHLHLIKR